MAIITQPPQATLTIVRPSGKKHLIAGTPEDIAWIAGLFEATKHNKMAARFLAKRVHHVERREFDRVVQIINMETPE